MIDASLRKTQTVKKFAMQHQHVTWTVDILFIYICKNVAVLHSVVLQQCNFVFLQPLGSILDDSI